MAELYRQPIVTNVGRTMRLADFLKRKDSIWFAFGKTSEWADENNPPVPNVNADTVEEISGLKKARKVVAVKEDPSGVIEYDGKKWTGIDDSRLFDEKAKYCYIEVLLESQELTASSYRQIGVFEGLRTGSTAQFITKTQVTDWGKMIILLNRKKVLRGTDQKEQLSLIVEF